MDIKFHLALPCRDLGETRNFYNDVILAKLGRHAENWLDVDLFGNQLTFTQSGTFNFDFKNYRLDNQILPSFHFGAIVPIGIWEELHARISELGLEFTQGATFLKDRLGEHISFFVKDPNGYMVEFKSFRDAKEVFSS